MTRYLLLAGVAGSTFISPLHAQDASSTPTRTTDYHTPESEEIIVTAPFLRNRVDVLSGTSVLTGEDLVRELRPTIGETLQRQPGVSATSFGPNASRPVLRGFQGERIRVLTDGIGSFDVSNTSVDHAVAINPLLADRIEVLRGPSALLFGSSAIGGVVNVVDSRIPRRLPDEAIHVEGLASYGSAANERSVAGAVDAPIGSGFVLHVDGSYLKTDDLDTGGFILSRPLREQAAASADAEIRELATLRGKLPNSAARTYDYAGGVAYVGTGGNFGVSVSRYDSLYGVPVRFSLDPEGEAEEVRLDVKQTRVDARGEVDIPGGLFESARMRLGHADYRHNELEDTGEIGTTFFNEAGEARLEFVQRERGGWRGAIGGQALIRDFNVVGEEKFLPRSATRQLGLFTLQTFTVGPFQAEAGARYERTRVRADADEDLGNPDISRRFNTYSGSLGASVGLGSRLRAGINLSHSERAPAAEELYANGPHAGTQSFEIGDPSFTKEKSNGAELTLRGTGERYSFGASAYYIRFDDYIYEQDTGEIEDDLPVFQFFQNDARYYGFEVEGSLRLAQLGDFALNVDGVADYVRARIKSTGPAPRIPPLRLLGGIELQSSNLNARAEVEHVDDQDRVAGFETPTKGYTMVNASVSFRPFANNRNTTILLSANNIFDVTARRHASFLKDFAPLAGRDLRVTARIGF
ncbi:MAG TPA: TonB-dependent receptor [Sphingomonadaceae bacterium]|nr:TonB-dependent receptor [Sphingomonadaceae bacterium]